MAITIERYEEDKKIKAKQGSEEKVNDDGESSAEDAEDAESKDEN